MRTYERILQCLFGLSLFTSGVCLFLLTPRDISTSELSVKACSALYYLSTSLVLLGGTWIYIFMPRIRVRWRPKKQIARPVPRATRRSKSTAPSPTPRVPITHTDIQPLFAARPARTTPVQHRQTTKPLPAEWVRAVEEIGAMCKNAEDPHVATALQTIEKRMLESPHHKPGTAHYWHAKAKAMVTSQ